MSALLQLRQQLIGSGQNQLADASRGRRRQEMPLTVEVVQGIDNPEPAIVGITMRFTDCPRLTTSSETS
jgi:hypothetical protein